MFWVKTDAVRALLEHDWKFRAFPKERNKVDGLIQHAIERMLGTLTLSNGYAISELIEQTNNFRLIESHSRHSEPEPNE
jgi:lipopolysaccharide biosynthesis protein